jgi:hypothetical protein
VKHRLPLAIGCLDVDLLLGNNILEDAFRKRYELFLRSDHRGSYPVTITWQNSAGNPEQFDPQVTFSPGAIHMSAPAYFGEIYPKRGASLQLTSPDPIMGIDHFLRVVVSALAFDAGGLLFHGAGILRHGKGYVFFGPSGVGKTTVSRLSGRDCVLNDDILLLQPGGSGWSAFSTPFWNPTQVKPTNQSMPVNGFYRLVQDQTVYLEPMSAAQAVAELVAHTLYLPVDPLRLPVLLERSTQIRDEIPGFYWLHFLEEDSFWLIVNPENGI